MAKLTLVMGILSVFSGQVLCLSEYYMSSRCNEDVYVDFSQQVRLKLDHHEYSDNMNCHLTIRTDYGDRFMVHFESMDIEPKFDCGYDFLTIHDGHTTYASSLTYNSRLCGSVKPTDLVSSCPALTFYFQSDDAIHRTGFNIILTPFSTGYCGSGEYECHNGRCISNSLSCTNHNPCGDYSDCQWRGVSTTHNPCDDYSDCQWHRGVSTSGIIGAIVGSVVIVVVLVIVIVLCRRRRAVVVRNPMMGVSTIQSPRVAMVTMQPPSYAQAVQFGSQQSLQNNLPEPPPYASPGVALPQPHMIPYPAATRVALSQSVQRFQNSTEPATPTADPTQPPKY